jgi:hypothetical protein
MPILAAEPQLVPPTLLETDPAWWSVALTRPRQEKALARFLVASGVAYYLPCFARRNRIRGRIVIATIPVFSGYVFVSGDPDVMRSVRTHRSLQQLLPVPDPASLTRDLRQVWQLVSTGLTLHPVDDVAVGTPVRIQSGPLAGLNGRIARHAGNDRLIVAVEFLGRGVSVEVDSRMLARMPRPRPVGAER